MTSATHGPDLSGRTAVVTGAGSGIGAAIARRLSAAGAAVTVLDVSPERADSVAAEISGRALVADLSDPDAVVALALTADILVNNAGLQHVAPLEAFPPEQFRLMWRLMVEAPFLLTRSVLPGMYAAGWGRLIHISSVHGLRASPYKSAYVTAKHGLEGLSKTVALEAGGRGVTSNCICPSYVRTPLVEGQIADQARMHDIPESEVVERIMLTESAVKRLIEPEEVADLAAWLCSPSASYVNGTSVSMDGGWTAR